MTDRRRSTRVRSLCLAVPLALVATLGVAAAPTATAASAVDFAQWVQAAPDPRMVSVDASGRPAVGLSGYTPGGGGTSMSRDGNRVAFLSPDLTLDPSSGPLTMSSLAFGVLYVRDRAVGQTTYEGFSDTGAQLQAIGAVALSGDGRWLAFTDCGDGTCALYVRDLTTHLTTLVNPSGTDRIAISDDGAVVAYKSVDATSGLAQVLVWHRGGSADVVAGSELRAMSGDGQHLVVSEPDSGGGHDVALDITSGIETAVTVAPDGVTPLPSGYSAAMSYDGRYVAFAASAPGYVDLPALDGCAATSCTHFYRRDLLTATTELVDQPDGLVDGTAEGSTTLPFGVAISSDGARVAFASTAAGLLPGVTLPSYINNAYVRDLTTHRTRLASTQVDGSPFAGFTIGALSLTADGSTLAFTGNRLTEHEWPEVFVISDAPPTAADADGVPDAVEAGAPNNGDGNGDGIPDSMQANVTSTPAAGGAPGAYVTVAAPAGTTLSAVATVDPASLATPPPAGTTLPVGLLSFVLYSLDNPDVTISVYGGPTTGVTDYAKFDPATSTWSVLPADRVHVYADHIDVTLTDGGIGDSDNSLNRAIVDPGGPAITDVTAPTVTAAPTTVPNANGWYRGDVAVRWTAVDPAPSSGGLVTPPDTLVTGEGSSLAASSAPACDAAHNCSTGHVTGLRIDRTAPTIAVGGVAAGRTYTLGAVPPATCTATDALSGTAGPCRGTLTGGNRNGVGSFTYTATATDLAGNTSITTTTFQVVYRVDGFLQPVNDPAATPGIARSVFRAGSLVPMRFQLKRADGVIVSPVTTPQWLAPVRGAASTSPVNEAVYVGVPSSGTSYTRILDQWVYLWKTQGQPAGATYTIGVRLDDGTSRTVVVALR